MLSKAKIKYIRSLELKKNRKNEMAFVAEGPKTVSELGRHFHCHLLIGTQTWFARNQQLQADEIIAVTEEELSRASFLKTPQEVLAVFEQPVYPINPEVIHTSLCLALDEVQDPGNLGTIIRLADWFGISDIFCSAGTADAYNPKTVQATMGALARVKIHYCDLNHLLNKASNIPVYGTFLDGEDLYEQPLSRNGLIIMGNEGNGIRDEIRAHVSRKIFIPNYPKGRETSESLNVAIATAVVCAEFRRRAISSFNEK